MAFDPTCLPPLPTCSDDFESWASQLIVCLTANFTTAFNNIAAVAVPPFNLCEEIGSLGPDCYLTHEGIDQTRFTFSEDPDEVVAGNGVLLAPPAPDAVEYRSGAVMQMMSGTCNGGNSEIIPLNPPMSTANYAVFLTFGNAVTDVYMSAPNEARRTNSFAIALNPRDCDHGEQQGCWVYWLVIKMS